MTNGNKIPYIYLGVSIFLILGGVIAFANLIFDLPYSRWAYNYMPTWLANCVITTLSLCVIIGAIPPKKRMINANLLLYVILVTMFIFLKPSYQLVPWYMKTIFSFSIIAAIVIRLSLRTSRINKEKG